MKSELRLIDANALVAAIENAPATASDGSYDLFEIFDFIDDAPAVDAIPVSDIEAWLYEIAMNNTDNTLSDACEEIIRRLDGLRQFSKERRTI